MGEVLSTVRQLRTYETEVSTAPSAIQLDGIDVAGAPLPPPLLSRQGNLIREDETSVGGDSQLTAAAQRKRVRAPVAAAAKCVHMHRGGPSQ